MHPVLFIDKIMKKERGIELATSFSEFPNMFIKIHFLVWHFESGNWKEKEKKQNIEYLKNKKGFLEEIYNLIHNF